jgi:hypothetical protein
VWDKKWGTRRCRIKAKEAEGFFQNRSIEQNGVLKYYEPTDSLSTGLALDTPPIHGA